MADDPRGRGIDSQVRLARAAVENLRPGDLAAELEEGVLLLVDVREADESAGGTIAGAVNIPRGLIEFVADRSDPANRPALDPRRRIVVLSTTGARSALAVHALYALGFHDVAHLDGGLAGWEAEGRAVTTTPAIG